MKIATLFKLAALAVILSACLVPRSSFASLYQIDDGSTEGSFGLTGFNSYDMIALNQFNVIGGNNMLESVQIAFGNPLLNDPTLNGLAYTVVVWDDPNHDGNPSDASYVTSAQNVISSANSNTLELTMLPSCVTVTDSFFVGFLITAGDNHGGGFQEPAAVDTSNFLPNRSFRTGSFGGAGDIYNLGNNGLLPLASYETGGRIGNFMIRANPCAAVPEPSAMVLLIVGGMGGLVGYRRRSKHVAARRAVSPTKRPYYEHYNSTSNGGGERRTGQAFLAFLARGYHGASAKPPQASHAIHARAATGNAPACCGATNRASPRRIGSLSRPSPPAATLREVSFVVR
jgi:hypothetical protein